jgi:hypothetical protein
MIRIRYDRITDIRGTEYYTILLRNQFGGKSVKLTPNVAEWCAAREWCVYGGGCVIFQGYPGRCYQWEIMDMRLCSKEPMLSDGGWKTLNKKRWLLLFKMANEFADKAARRLKTPARKSVKLKSALKKKAVRRRPRVTA